MKKNTPIRPVFLKESSTARIGSESQRNDNSDVDLSFPNQQGPNVGGSIDGSPNVAPGEGGTSGLGLVIATASKKAAEVPASGTGPQVDPPAGGDHGDGNQTDQMDAELPSNEAAAVSKPKQYKNAFLFFVPVGREIVKQKLQQDNLPFPKGRGELNKEIGKLWNSLSVAEKDQYVQQAAPGKQLFLSELVKYNEANTVKKKTARKDSCPLPHGGETSTSLLPKQTSRKQSKTSEVADLKTVCRTLVDINRSLLFHLPVPPEIWMPVLNTADLDDDLKFRAIRLFEVDPASVHTFMSMDPVLYRRWLVARLARLE